MARASPDAPGPKSVGRTRRPRRPRTHSVVFVNPSLEGDPDALAGTHATPGCPPVLPRLKVGEGVLATFDSPAQTIRCALAIREATRGLDLAVRVGIHTGEIELRDHDIAGIAVHLAQRVQSVAQAGEVLASRTVVDLVAGSGIRFVDRGVHALKGVPDEWQLYVVEG